MKETCCPYRPAHDNCTVKPVLSGHLKIDKTKVVMENGSLMKDESIAECWSIENQFSVFFLSGRLRQVLLYFLRPERKVNQ